MPLQSNIDKANLLRSLSVSVGSREAQTRNLRTKLMVQLSSTKINGQHAVDTCAPTGEPILQRHIDLLAILTEYIEFSSQKDLSDVADDWGIQSYGKIKS